MSAVGRVKYCTGLMPEDLANQVEVHRLAAVESDLEPFMRTPLSKLSGLTADDLLEVWSALTLLVEEHSDQLRLSKVFTNVMNFHQFEQLAPVEETARIVSTLVRCTKLPRAKCLVALKLFTWRNVRDSIWSRPLINLDSGERFVIVLPAFKTQNLRRSIEYWLTEGGLDLGERGNPFEEYVRNDLRDAIKQNHVLALKSDVARSQVTPDDLAVGDIDLLLWIDRTILVAEVKCLLRPGSAFEDYKYEGRIREAAKQVSRKADYVKGHLTWLANISPETAHLSKEPIRIVPCVIINSAVGALRVIKGVPVIDVYVIRRYLAEGFGIMNAAIGNEETGTRINFYSNVTEAADRLEEFLRSPDHLQAYRRSAILRSRRQPDFETTNDCVTVVSPSIQLPTSNQGRNSS